MTVIKGFEGFDTWASAVDGLGKGWTFPGAHAVTFQTGRFGGQSMGAGGDPRLITRSLSATQTTMWIGAAFFTDSAYNGTGSAAPLLGLSTTGTQVIRLTENGSNASLQLLDSAGGSTTIGSFVFPGNNEWTYLEIGVTAGPSGSGQVIVRQDGASLGTFALSTTGSLGNYFDGLLYSCPWSGGSVGNIDDIYWNNGAGVDADFCGPMRVVVDYPSGDTGSAGSWTPSAGSTFYNLVNEAQEDGAATTITSVMDNDTIAFDFTSISGTIGEIIGVQPLIAAAGIGASVASKITSGGTLQTGSFSSLATTYTTFAPDCIELDPGTGSRWTISGYNAATKGIVKGAP